MNVPWQGLSCSRENSPHPFSLRGGWMTPQAVMEQFWDPWVEGSFPWHIPTGNISSDSFPLGIFPQALSCDAPSFLPMGAALFFPCLAPFPKEQTDPGLFFKCLLQGYSCKKSPRELGPGFGALSEGLGSESPRDFSIKATPGCELGASGSFGAGSSRLGG